MKVCTKCEISYSEEDKFCKKCGEQLKNGNVCFHCGKINEEDVKYCVFCGKKVNGLTKRCDCGARNPEDAITCYACGRPLEFADKNRVSETKKTPWLLIFGIFAALFIAFAAVSFFI